MHDMLPRSLHHVGSEYGEFFQLYPTRKYILDLQEALNKLKKNNSLPKAVPMEIAKVYQSQTEDERMEELSGYNLTADLLNPKK